MIWSRLLKLRTLWNSMKLGRSSAKLSKYQVLSMPVRRMPLWFFHNDSTYPNYWLLCIWKIVWSTCDSGCLCCIHIAFTLKLATLVLVAHAMGMVLFWINTLICKHESSRENWKVMLPFMAQNNATPKSYIDYLKNKTLNQKMWKRKQNQEEGRLSFLHCNFVYVRSVSIFFHSINSLSPPQNKTTFTARATNTNMACFKVNWWNRP